MFRLKQKEKEVECTILDGGMTRFSLLSSLCCETQSRVPIDCRVALSSLVCLVFDLSHMVTSPREVFKVSIMVKMQSLGPALLGTQNQG